MKNGDVFWIKMDIDGAGRRWRLAFIRPGREGDMIVYPLDDFEDYYDDQCDRYEVVRIERPDSAPLCK